MTNVTYPQKKFNGGQCFGRISCEPYSQTGAWGYGINFLPSDGSTNITFASCNGTPVTYPALGSNLKGFMLNNNWGFELGITQYTMYSYPAELVTLGAGYTQMDKFKSVYMDYCEANGIKYWIELAEIMNDQNLSWTWRTPGTTQSWYTPPAQGGHAIPFAASYEARIGAAIDFIEANAGPNFQGYSFESCFQNGLEWLRGKTSYAISEKNWNCFYHNWIDAGGGISMLDSTNASDGSTVTPTVTALQHISLLDELIIEIYDSDTTPYSQLNMWVAAVPSVVAAYPNLPIVLNVDQVCAGAGWANGAPVETGTDYGYWAPTGVGEPSNRIATEEAYAMTKITALHNALGKQFAGMCYNSYIGMGPYGGNSVPPAEWFLQWAETNVSPLLQQSSAISVSKNITLSI